MPALEARQTNKETNAFYSAVVHAHEAKRPAARLLALFSLLSLTGLRGRDSLLKCSARALLQLLIGDEATSDSAFIYGFGRS